MNTVATQATDTPLPAATVANHYLRALHHCLRTGEPYDEVIAARNYCRTLD